MHETILKTFTVAIVAGLAVYWLTAQKEHAEYAGKFGGPRDYKPTLGDVRTVRFGRPSCACCQCCGLVTPETTSSPLAADYLDCAPQYAPAASGWNLGVSMQITCEGLDLDAVVHREETTSTFPFTLRSNQRTTPLPARISQRISCSPNVPLTVDCTEVI